MKKIFCFFVMLILFSSCAKKSILTDVEDGGAQQELVSGETWGATRTKINANDTELYNAIDTKMTTTTYDSTADGVIDESALPNTLTNSDDNETISGTWTFGNFKFSQITTPTYSQGMLFYSSSEDTLIFYDSHSGTSIEIVREDRIDVFNSTGSTIPDGSVCTSSGNTGDQFNIVLADKDTVADHGVIGIATYDIETGTAGEIVSFGKVHNLNTTGSDQSETWTEDDPIYVGDDGALTNVKPTSGKIVYVGTVLRSHATEGTIFINIGSALNASDITTGTLSDSIIPSTITRDTEWDTAAKINAVTTDTDFVLDTDIGTTVLSPTGDGSGLSGVVTSESDPVTGAINGIIKADGAGNISAAISGTDYEPADATILKDADIGATVQAWDADLDTYAGITPSANVQSLLAAATYQAFLDLLAPYNLSPTGDIDFSGANSFTSGPIAFTGTATLPGTPTDGQAVYYTGGTFDVFGMYFTDTWQYFLAFDTFPTQDNEVLTYTVAGGIDWAVPSGSVDDTAYGASWDGDTTTAASKNAIYDKIEAISVAAPTVQASDPTANDSTGWYLATGSGDTFYVRNATDVWDVSAGTQTAYYLLTLSDPGNANTITSTDTFLDCGDSATDCTYYYASAATPELTATAASGYEFLAWTGDATDTSTTTNPDTITMNAAKSVGASFNLLPTVSSVEQTDANTAVVTLSEAITIGSGGSGGLVVTGSTTGASATTLSSGDTTAELTYATTETFVSGETITWAYTQPGAGWEDSDGGDVASDSGSATNSISGTAYYEYDFEESGIPTGWSTILGTVDYDATTTLMIGDQYMSPSQYGRAQTPSFSATDGVVTVSFAMRLSEASANTLVFFRNASDTNEFSMLYDGSSVYFQNSADTPIGVTGTVSASTITYFWVTITTGTGSDGELSLYINTTDSQPGTATDSATNLINTADIDSVVFTNTSSSGLADYDRVQIPN